MAYTFKYGDRPLDGYTIQRAVGRGGFGEVYYAMSDGGREVAIKYLRDNPQVELRGVANCINLKSPYLVAIFDVKKTYDGEYAIIMEYCSGPSLRDLLMAEPNGFPPQKAAFFLREIAKGLSYLHDRGIVHRDLKPGNIFYDDGYVKIGDYGLSKFISVSRHSAQTASVGTVHYMAPEVGSGDYSRGIDIYALGVIAHEMLRGRVPFEGSTMAEILMKHLTSEPELENLPHPFGGIIRKALEKDTRQRYQTVNEMIDALLEVESIQESLAGFSIQSLDGAVARGGVARDPSPIPSPNPAPGIGRFGGAGRDERRGAPLADTPLPDRLSKRLDKLNRRVEAKVAKLGGKHRNAGSPPSLPAFVQATREAIRSPERRRRVALGALLSVGLAVGLGIVCGANLGEEAGVAAGLLVPALLGSVGLSSKAIPWFGALNGPAWARFMIQIGCSAPLLAIGAAPVLDSGNAREGFAVWLGLLVVAVFANWPKTIERAADGDMSFGRALWMAFGALVATAIASGFSGVDPEEYMFLSAGVAGVASLIVQASMWWTGAAHVGVGTQEAGFQRSRESAPAARRAPLNTETPTTPWPPYAQPVVPPVTYTTPAVGYATKDAGAVQGAGQHGSAMGSNVPRTRWTVTRAFWSVVAFILMGGAIVNFLVTLILVDLKYDERTGTILGCIACSAALVFALRKTTMLKRDGFWRETVAPLLLSVALFGVGGNITGISRHWWEFHTEERVLSIIGLVMSSLAMSAMLAVANRPRKRPVFLQPGSSVGLGSVADGARPAEPPSGAALSEEPSSSGGAVHGVGVGRSEDSRI